MILSPKDEPASGKWQGLVLQNQGKYEAAEEMNRQALEGKRLLEPGHPDTLLSDSNKLTTN